MAYAALELPHRLGVADVQLTDRPIQAVAQDQQRRLVHVRHQTEHEVRVVELGGQTGFGVAEERVAAVADDDEGVAATHDARVAQRRRVAALVKTVIAEAAFEIVEVAAGVGQGGGIAGGRHQTEADEVGACELLHVVDGEVGHQRHAMVFELTDAQRPGLFRIVWHQGLEQEFPVGGDAGRAMCGDKRQVVLALLVVRGRQLRAVGGEPRDALQAVRRATVGVPEVRVGATEVEQHTSSARCRLRASPRISSTRMTMSRS